MECYWERFLKTGNPEDYLIYKTGNNLPLNTEGVMEQEMNKIESDCADRNGAFGYADRRI